MPKPSMYHVVSACACARSSPRLRITQPLQARSVTMDEQEVVNEHDIALAILLYLKINFSSVREPIPSRIRSISLP